MHTFDCVPVLTPEPPFWVEIWPADDALQVIVD